MSDKKSKGVKRNQLVKNCEEMLRGIAKQMKAFNALYGTDYVIISDADIDKQILEASTRAYNYSEQYTADVMFLTLHEDEGYGGERLKRLNEGYLKRWMQYDCLKAEERKENGDAWYAEEQFERALRSACGKYYVPREERYKTIVDMEAV